MKKHDLQKKVSRDLFTRKKFEETGAVTYIARRVHHRLAGSAENIAAVSQSVAEDRCVDCSSFSGIRTVFFWHGKSSSSESSPRAPAGQWHSLSDC